MKYVFLSIAMLGIFSMVIARQTHAAPFTLPFGGKIITRQLPGVACVPPNAGPVVTSQTISGLATAGFFATNSSYSAGARAGGAVAGIYSSIPIYTTDPRKVTKPGGYILGRHLAIPNFQYCKFGTYPFPVMQTTIYGVSK